MYKKALIIGRFQPIHVGHVNLIKRYSKAGYFIKIAIGSSQKSFEKHNPLTSKERDKKIRLAMQEFNIDKYKIYHVPDINNDSNYVKHVLKIVGKFDIIVTGNPKILKLFVKYNSKKMWDIESFEERTERPGGKITSGIIRDNWLKEKNYNKGLPHSVVDYLKSIHFSERLKKLHSRKKINFSS